MTRLPVLMLPGMMQDARLFEAQTRELARQRPVLVADLGSDQTIGAMATRVLSAAPPRFALVGLSMGGIVALEIWRRARARVSHLALLDTTPHAEKPQRRELRLQQIEQAERGYLRDVLIESMKPLYLARRHRGDRALLERILEMGLQAGPAVFRNQSLALRDRPDSVATLRDIDCPSLVLCGREDELCPPKWHVQMAEAMPCADLVVLAECGHLPPLEDPRAVTTALDRLLGRTH